jgi:hypothetical protein
LNKEIDHIIKFCTSSPSHNFDKLCTSLQVLCYYQLICAWFHLCFEHLIRGRQDVFKFVAETASYAQTWPCSCSCFFFCFCCCYQTKGYFVNRVSEFRQKVLLIFPPTCRVLLFMPIIRVVLELESTWDYGLLEHSFTLHIYYAHNFEPSVWDSSTK